MSDSQSRATGPVSFFEVFTAITYPATLIILGLKASTCFSSVFIVFPVPTIACNGKDRNWIEKANRETLTSSRFLSNWRKEEDVGHTVLVYEPFSKNYLIGKGNFKKKKKKTRDVLHITDSDLSHWEEVKVVAEQSHISVPCHLRDRKDCIYTLRLTFFT